MRKFLASLLEVVEVAIVAVGAVFLVRAFLVQPFLVSGSSMVPNFQNGDYLLVDELTYRIRAPERGEVIVFHCPPAACPGDTSTYFIKRIIGLPGEQVIVKNGTVRIVNNEHPQGFTLDETYVPKGTTTGNDQAVTLKPGQYSVFGDNRMYSFDSRAWGPLRASEIVGVVRLRLWPPQDFTAFAAPNY